MLFRIQMLHSEVGNQKKNLTYKRKKMYSFSFFIPFGRENFLILVLVQKPFAHESLHECPCSIFKQNANPQNRLDLIHF